MDSKKPRITLRQVLATVACIIIAFVMVLIIIPSSSFPLKSYLDDQELLAPVIAFFGVIAASFIAGLILTVVNERIQTYSWRRDQALKDIETIYKPLYIDVSKVVEKTENFISYTSSEANWNSINNSYLGTKLELMEKKLHRRLKTLFEDMENYNHRWNEGEKMVREILKKLIEPYVDESVQDAERRQQICHDTAGHWDFVGRLPQGFLMGKSVGEWSSLAFGQSEEEFIERRQREMRGLSSAQHTQRAIEQIEVILNQTYQAVQDDVEITRFREWCKALTTEAARLKNELEKHILQPQLS